MTDWLVADSLAPNVDGALAPLYEAAARGEVALPYCRCGLPLELDQVRCDGCGSTQIAWRTVEPTGVVHAATTVHRREPGLILAGDPYHVVDVELTSGHRLLMTTTGPAAFAPSIGEEVEIAFRRVGNVAIPALANYDPTPTEVVP